MERLQNQQLFSLLHYLEAYVEPVAVEAKIDDRGARAFVTNAGLAEALGWLHLGVEVQFFDRSHVESWWRQNRAVLREGFAKFEELYKSTLHPKFMPWLG